ncbi:MAG: MBL fold metallo-hydrolase [Bacteroidetes bacterium]|nr:MBL fold metallo-hydrolase [Bacteroidota bacterium]
MGNFTIRFWGVRGSYPIPGAQSVRFGGNTSCVELNIGNRRLIIDGGTGIIGLGNQMLKESFAAKKAINTTILFSHMHHDHNQGFPFFKPAFIDSTTLHIFGPRSFQMDFDKVLAGILQPPFFPVELSEMRSKKFISNISENDILLMSAVNDTVPRLHTTHLDKSTIASDDILVEVLKSFAHPKGGTLFFKVSYKDYSMVFASDTEGYLWDDQKLINFAKNADVLIHDAQYTTEDYIGQNGFSRQGFGHSTPEIAIEVAKKANVKQLVLFHHDPEYSDEKIALIEAHSRMKHPDCIAAYEGLSIDLTKVFSKLKRVQIKGINTI